MDALRSLGVGCERGTGADEIIDLVQTTLARYGLAQAAVAYSLLTLIALALIGWYAFGETMGPREIAGLACACLAMVLMVRIA